MDSPRHRINCHSTVLKSQDFGKFNFKSLEVGVLKMTFFLQESGILGNKTETNGKSEGEFFSTAFFLSSVRIAA